MDSKFPTETSTGGDIRTSIELANVVAVYEKYGTQHDKMDMDRMGKLQQLRVRLCDVLDNALMR